MGAFYDKDVRYVASIPMIDNKFVDLPSIIEIGDEEELVWEPKVDDDVIEKGLSIYASFKKSNKKRFI